MKLVVSSEVGNLHKKLGTNDMAKNEWNGFYCLLFYALCVIISFLAAKEISVKQIT